MFAVVEIAGFQEIVKEGDTLKVPLLDAEKGKKMTFAKVLMLANGDNLTFGAPVIAGASVEVEILGDGRHEKVRVVKVRRRKRYRRVHGHKQDYTEVKVTKIAAK
jgi:large subunit ribosomal protein L21